MRSDQSKATEFGDFQTPIGLARKVCELVRAKGFEPASVIEPTCGQGAFVQAALEVFPHLPKLVASDLNEQHIERARGAADAVHSQANIEIRRCDFFRTDWDALVARLPKPILVLGNPPWVTSAALGALGSANVPTKSNADKLRGIDALTGSSNFDISEWMLRRNVEWLSGKKGMLAVLCKTAVARKVLLFAWRNGLPVESASLYRLDATQYFGTSVEACLLTLEAGSARSSRDCAEYEALGVAEPATVFGFRDGRLIANVPAYEQWSHLRADGLRGWRSGIKHDCKRVFELQKVGGQYRNGLGGLAGLEADFVLPLLKSSDVAANREPHSWLLVPQRSVNEDTGRLRDQAPGVWRYLVAHSELLDRRRSSVYRNRPRFSVFGVGPYSFAPWKVATSGLHKKLGFARVGPFGGQPVVLDDTCYFFPCKSKSECDLLWELVSSEPAIGFLTAFIFWDAKRPVTAGLLNSLDLAALAQLLGKEGDIARVLAERQVVRYSEQSHQGLLVREQTTEYGLDASSG